MEGVGDEDGETGSGGGRGCGGWGRAVGTGEEGLDEALAEEGGLAVAVVGI